MNILSEEQALARQLELPQHGVLEDLSAEFVAKLQASGAFVEYNQQVIVSAEEMIDYVSCIVAGRTKISRLDADYGKAEVARLGAGEWFGEANLFTRVASTAEVFADGEVVIWTIPHEMLRSLFFEDPEAVRLLYNFARRLAEKITPEPAKLSAAPATG